MVHADHRDKVSNQLKAPLYQQIYQVLRRQIMAGQWLPNALLPSEAALVAQYGVSRATVRQALDGLVSDGLVVRRQGKGTFIAAPTVSQGLVRIISFTEDMRQRGLLPSTKLISAELVPASRALAERLAIAEGELLARIERLRLANGVPMSVEVSLLVHRFCPGILAQDYTTHSLRRVLEHEHQIRITGAQQTIRAISAPDDLAQALGIQPGAPLLAIERLSFSEAGVPLEYLRLYHRGDRYTLHADLRG